MWQDQMKVKAADDQENEGRKPLASDMGMRPSVNDHV